MIGSRLPGKIVKIKCDKYTFEGSDGPVELAWRWDYIEEPAEAVADAN